MFSLDENSMDSAGELNLNRYNSIGKDPIEISHYPFSVQVRSHPDIQTYKWSMEQKRKKIQDQRVGWCEAIKTCSCSKKPANKNSEKRDSVTQVKLH